MLHSIPPEEEEEEEEEVEVVVEEEKEEEEEEIFIVTTTINPTSFQILIDPPTISPTPGIRRSTYREYQ